MLNSPHYSMLIYPHYLCLSFTVYTGYLCLTWALFSLTCPHSISCDPIYT